VETLISEIRVAWKTLFHENAGLSYVIDYSEIVIIHDSIKLICHMLKGFKELLCFILEINILGEHGRK
jgi:hypothetical protein